MKGKAVVFTDRMQVSVQEVEIPEPSEHDVVIDVEVSWISNGTESSFLRGERIGGDTAYTDGSPWPFPIVAGYQKVGIVRRVGRSVQAIQPGDRVFAALSRVQGMFDAFGGHISPAVTPADQVWKLPVSADPITYSGLVLAQVGLNCGNRPNIESGDTAIVIGDGLVGQWAAQTLLHRGARVYVAGRHDARLSLLPPGVLGWNAATESIGSMRERIGNGGEVSVLVDTVGDLPFVEKLLPMMKRESHLVSAGFYGHAGVLDLQNLRNQEITLHSPSGWTRERMDATIAGIQEQWLQTSSLITHRFSVDDAAAAWELILDKNQFKLGVVLEWQQQEGPK